MRNIHILETNQPSRLCIDNSCNELNYSEKEGLNSKHITNQCMYITSLEEIKEGDYALFLDYKTVHRADSTNGYVFYADDTCKKIILTTNPILIADGVQAIDDDFLEWFVENPTCEFVDVVDDYNHPKVDCHNYKTIIPIEGPDKGYVKSETEFLGIEFTLKDDSKQFIGLAGELNNHIKKKTLEEAAEKYAVTNGVAGWLKDAFIAGSNWQAERIHSNKEVEALLEEYDRQLKIDTFAYTKPCTFTVKEWFEKFKKK